MLDERKRPLWDDQFRSAVELESVQKAGVLIGSRPVVALVLVAAGVVWAIARGLRFYGVSPADLIYDLDQPPLLLMFVGAWLLYRNRR